MPVPMAPPPNPDAGPPYVAGIDDLGENPLGVETAPAAVSTDPTPQDPVASEAQYRRAVLTLLCEIRDILLADTEG